MIQEMHHKEEYIIQQGTFKCFRNKEFHSSELSRHFIFEFYNLLIASGKFLSQPKVWICLAT